MSAPAQNGPKWRNNPFIRNSASPSPGPTSSIRRPKSTIISSPLSEQPFSNMGHARNQSFSALYSVPVPSRTGSIRTRSNSGCNSTPAGTFAPQFITSDETEKGPERIRGIEGENDFSGKRYVWLKDPKTAFVKGWVVEELEDDRLLVQCDDGSVRMEIPLPLCLKTNNLVATGG